MKITIEVNGKPAEIELTEEQIEQINKKDKFKWSYKKNKTFFVDYSIITEKWDGDIEELLDHGRYRSTLEQAEASLERNKRANRLEALVYQLQDEVGGDYYIFKGTESGEWFCSNSKNYYPERILMREDTAKKICKILNNNEFSLDGELE